MKWDMFGGKCQGMAIIIPFSADTFKSINVKAMFNRNTTVGYRKVDMIAGEDITRTNGLQPLFKQQNVFIQTESSWTSIDQADKNATAPVEWGEAKGTVPLPLSPPAAAPVALPGNPCTLQNRLWKASSGSHFTVAQVLNIISAFETNRHLLMKLQIFLFSCVHDFAAWKYRWNIEQPTKVQDLIQPM